MADNIVVNETTYNDVEAVSMVNENGNEILYYPDAVRYNAQNLTETQKAQARENIGAITEKDAPVKSVNNKTGVVSLNAEDVGARPNTWMPSAADVEARPNTWTPTAEDVGARPDTWTPSYSDVGADKSGTAESKVSAHNVSDASHNDIRLLIQGLGERLNAIANSTDVDLNDFKEVVAYIKANRGLIDAITTNKINYTDIINDLVTNVTNKPLSAAQGVVLKALIDAITVPTKVSELQNDKGYLTSYTESDPTVPAWAKAASKPSYTKSEVGLGNVDNVKQYSSSNPPPYPVTKVNNKTGDVTLSASDVGALSESTLTSAIDTALAQAKASGKFKGEDGYSIYNSTENHPEIGEPYIELGVSSIYTHGRDIKLGDFVIIQSYLYNVANHSSNAVEAVLIADLKGSDGKDGKTPVKGTDYFTPADKTEIVNAVVAEFTNARGAEF